MTVLFRAIPSDDARPLLGAAPSRAGAAPGRRSGRRRRAAGSLRDGFGELALLHDTARSATILTLERTTLWGLDCKTFRGALESVNAQNYQENKRFIESVLLFQILTPIQR